MAQPTMKDIAGRVGVSRTAVSFVLNGKARQRGISRKVERNVLRTAEDMGYRPSLVARSLASRKTMTIGLLLPNMGVTYGPPLAEAIETAAEQHGYQVILGHHHSKPEQFAKTLNAMLGWKVDGLAVVPMIGLKDSPVYGRFAASDVPKVMLESDIGDSDHHLVMTDVVQATTMAVEHLLKLGHRRIALFNSADALVESRHREHAYRRLLAEARVDVDDRLIVRSEIDESPDETQAKMERVLSLPERPTAAVAISAMRAEATYRAARDRGLSIPDDLSVVAITGSGFTDFHRVKFTCVRLTYSQVGAAAFSILKEDIDHGPLAPRRVFTAPAWHDGESTRALPVGDATAS